MGSFSTWSLGLKLVCRAHRSWFCSYLVTSYVAAALLVATEISCTWKCFWNFITWWDIGLIIVESGLAKYIKSPILEPVEDCARLMILCPSHDRKVIPHCWTLPWIDEKSNRHCEFFLIIFLISNECFVLPTIVLGSQVFFFFFLIERSRFSFF